MGNEIYELFKKNFPFVDREEELRNSVKSFILKHKYFDEKFRQYNIKSFDTSFDRDKVLNSIVDNLERVKAL